MHNLTKLCYSCIKFLVLFYRLNKFFIIHYTTCRRGWPIYVTFYVNNEVVIIPRFWRSIVNFLTNNVTPITTTTKYITFPFNWSNGYRTYCLFIILYRLKHRENLGIRKFSIKLMHYRSKLFQINKAENLLI